MRVNCHVCGWSATFKRSEATAAKEAHDKCHEEWTADELPLV